MLGFGMRLGMGAPLLPLSIPSLFANGEQGAWWDPSDASTVFQDAAGTVPGAVDSPVGRINDKSGNGNHLLQTTDARRPILRQDGGTFYTEGDAVDDFLRTGPMNLSAFTALTVALAIRPGTKTPHYLFSVQAQTAVTGQPLAVLLEQEISTVRYGVVQFANSVDTRLSRSGAVVEPSVDQVVMGEYAYGGVSGYKGPPPSLVGQSIDGPPVTATTALDLDSNLPFTDAALGNAQYAGLGVIYNAGSPILHAEMRFHGGVMVTRKLSLQERWSLTRRLAAQQGRAL